MTNPTSQRPPRFGWRLLPGLASLTLTIGVLGLVGCPEGPVEQPETRSGCLNCHAPLDADGVATGIEDAHPAQALACTFCHGGAARAQSMEAAHVPTPDGIDGPAHVRSMSSVELDAIDPEYLRWINPTDYRVVQIPCGPCHQEIVESAPNSIMTTFAGHFANSRYSMGTQNTRSALYGVRDQGVEVDPFHGTTEGLETLVAPLLDESSPLGDFLDQYLVTGCPRCHVWNFGPNDIRGDYRSSGCAGCHMPYSNEGLSRSADPTADWDDPPHPLQHALTTAIPDMQCEHCHYRGNRIGTMYRGVRESGRLNESEFAEYSLASVHGREPGFFIHDEDTRNDYDETPPDIHYTQGLGCVDCHTGVDVHGDENLYSSHDFQVGVECVDCHGTPEQRISADDEGVFRTTYGDALVRVSQIDDRFVLTSALDGSAHPLVQLAELQALGDNEDLLYAHGRDQNGFSHLDSMECYTCHTAWTQSCFGCHVTVDMRSNGTSLIDGSVTQGRASGLRSWVTLDYLALGMGVDGQITPMAPQEKMYITVIMPCDPDTEECTEGVTTPAPGRRLFDQQVRYTQDGLLGMGFGPVMPHTTSRTSQPCDRCHLREDESNWDIINETLGRGSARFQIPDGDGVLYDLTQVVDENGRSIVSLAHEGSDVLPLDMVERMLRPRVPNSGLELREFPEWEAP